MIAALALALALDVTPPAPPTAVGAPCTDAAVAAAVQAASAAAKADPIGAKAAIAPAAACPVHSGPTYSAHVLRADLAVREGDWTTARAMLVGVGVHPEASISRLAGFLRLRADQGLNDPTAFARDRADLLRANDAVLARLGHKLESFRAGAARVDAYDAPVAQGGFRRLYEFIATPDDPTAYPMSVLVTDDRNAVGMGKEMAKPGAAAPEHAWFFDLYSCGGQATLHAPVEMFGPAPSYAQAKAAAMEALSQERPSAAPEKAACFTYLWLLPGLGAHAPAA